jgi:hypothetical protein
MLCVSAAIFLLIGNASGALSETALYTNSMTTSISFRECMH